MVEDAIRLIRPGLHRPKRTRLATFLVLVLLLPIFNPFRQMYRSSGRFWLNGEVNRSHGFARSER